MFWKHTLNQAGWREAVSSEKLLGQLEISAEWPDKRIRCVCDKVHGEKGHAKNAQKKVIGKYIPF